MRRWQNSSVSNPLVTDPLNWGSLTELSHLLGRPINTIYKQLVSGTLADFNIRSYQDRHLRWWVTIDPSLRKP